MGFKFGSFDSICGQAALPVCPLLGTSQGIEPVCYSRNVDLGGTLIFQPGASFIHIIALIMTFIMVLHIRSKYTAVGRKEIVLFFYTYAIVELLCLFLDSGIIPTAHVVYPWFTAIHVGLICALFWILLANGFIGFQFAEDGTPTSLWALRISAFVVWAATFFIAIATFNGYASFSYTKPLGLFIVLLVFPIVCVAIYIVSQLILVLRTLDDRWVLGDIIFGSAFFAAGSIIFFAFSVKVCDGVEHYIDGLFFFVLCMLLSVMMVYKYWDSITKEDLEFAVGDKGAVWEVKDHLLAPHADFGDEDQSQYGGGGGSLVNGGGGNQYYGSQNSRGGYAAYPPSGSSQGHGSSSSKQGFYNSNSPGPRY